MRIGRSNSPAKKTEVVVLTADAGFEEQARSTFGASEQIELRVVSGSLAVIDDGFELDGATVAVVDLDAGQQAEMQALEDGTVIGHFQATGVRPRFLADLINMGIKIPGSYFDPSQPL
jgi:hypothetical protein